MFRTRKRHRQDRSPYPWIARETGVVNQFYFYCPDADFGPFFLKICSYFPFNLPVQRQAVPQRQRVRPTSGRPDRVALIFGRKIYRGRKNHNTPGTFMTRVVTDGVTPSLHIQYKHAQIKQYHKEGRALRTETTINDPMDFDLRKGLTHLRGLARIGYPANRRLLRVQRLSHDPITGADAVWHEVTCRTPWHALWAVMNAASPTCGPTGPSPPAPRGPLIVL